MYTYFSEAVMEIQSAGTELRERCEELRCHTVSDFLLCVYNEPAWSEELGTRIGFPQYDTHSC